MTTLSDIYNAFLSKITDDMYMEISKAETEELLSEFFQNSLHWFEFPRFNLYDFDLESEEYNCILSLEEINIIATYMVVEWIGQ